MSNEPAPSPVIKSLKLVVGIALILWSRLLLRLGLRKPIDGWRHGAGLVLKGDAAKFVLSAFDLDVFSDAAASADRSADEVERYFANRLAAFLQAESEFHVVVRHEPDGHRAAPHHGPSYTLGFEPPPDGPGRFIRPDVWTGRHGDFSVEDASPVFQFIGRVNSGGLVDLWVRVNHVGTDGVPVQEMLSRLEKQWGVGQPVLFPGITEFEPFESPRHSPGRAETVEVQTFVDFAPLLAWRKVQNQKLPEPMTFSAAMLWWLGRQEAFANIYIGTTVEVAAVGRLKPGVGIVVVRPADYFDEPDGLAQYVVKFNRDLALTRERRSESCKTLDAAAHIPRGLEEQILRHALDGGRREFGSAALTVLKDAKVFGAPLPDAGHVNGFIAVGCVSCDSTDGKRVGCVVVKGPRSRIAGHARVIREAMAAVSAESLST